MFWQSVSGGVWQPAGLSAAVFATALQAWGIGNFADYMKSAKQFEGHKQYQLAATNYQEAVKLKPEECEAELGLRPVAVAARRPGQSAARPFQRFAGQPKRGRASS